MSRNPQDYSYSSYPENYYDSYQIQQAQQQQQQQQQHQHPQHQQQHQQQQHYQHLQQPGYAHATQQHVYPSGYGHPSQHGYASSSQAGPSYYPGSSQLYQVAVEEEYHEESPSPSVPSYEEHSPTYPSFGQFQLDPSGAYGENNNIEHIITEHELSSSEVAAYFPAANKTEIHTDKGVLWRCKICAKEIPARSKIEHIFKHKDQPRYTCTCKAKFARGQDKNRHLKEQALCSECQTTKVGRRGQNGRCQMCL